MVHGHRLIALTGIAVAALYGGNTATGSACNPAEVFGPPAQEAEPSASPPREPRVRLAPVSGYADEEEYQRHLAERVAELVTAAEGSSGDERRVRLLLAAANSILGQVLEPACTMRLLRVPEEPVGASAEQIASALDRAEDLIAQADAICERSGDGDRMPAEALAGWKQRLGTLEAFAVALRAYLTGSDAAEGLLEARRAASRLAPLLEDKDVAVAKAGALWQAALRGGEADPGPALSVLDLALADPPAKSQPYAFFARLLRCRLIAGRGGSVAAIALLLQMEERCREWFKEGEERDAAIRTVQLVRIQVMQARHAELASTDAGAERQWCADQIAILKAEGFADDRATVARLIPAIPIVVSPPDDQPKKADAPSESK